MIENNSTAIAWLGLLVIFGQYVFFTRGIKAAVAAKKNTSFRDADLIDADFTEAILKNTDFTEAIIIRTNWYQAELDKANVNRTMLVEPKVRKLVVTRQGAGQDYSGYILRGINLADADLKNANLTDTDFSEATFEQANLNNTNLTRAKVLGTNFQGANLTGAILKDWQVNKDTQIEDVICDYVYLRHNQANQLERFPQDPQRNFTPGEFAKLSQKTLETIDLIFQDSFDLQAFLTSFDEVQVESGDDKLAIQSIEKKNNDIIVIQVNVSSDLDKGEIAEFLRREYINVKDNYQQAIVAIEDKYQARLQAKEEEIEMYRQEISYLRKLVQKLSEIPIVINSNSVDDVDEAV